MPVFRAADSRGLRFFEAWTRRGKVKIMAGGKKAKNVTKTAKGKVKETTGKAVGNESLEMKGRAEQVEGDMKQAGEKVKDAFKR